MTAYPKIPPPPIKGQGKQLTFGAISANPGGIVVFTDGSGGTAGSDTRLRRCGWAYSQIEASTHRLVASHSGVLEGPVQTVTRAELTAFAEALRGTPQGLNLTVVSDSAYVVNEFAKLQGGVLPMKHRDIWAAIKRHMLCRPDRSIRCVKVKAHTTEDDLAKGRYGITVFTREGNDLADAAANQAAEEAAVPSIETREVQAQDASGYVILRRLVTINMHCVKLDVYKYDKTLDAKLDWKGSMCKTAFLNEHFRATTHTYVALSDGWKCTVCRTFTSRALLESWLSTPCPGEVQTYRGIRSGRRLVHYTHNLRQTRGVLWCKSCGFFAVHRCDLLADKRKCIGLVRMPTPAGQAFLQRISRGLPPVGYAVWPDENTIGDMRPPSGV